MMATLCSYESCFGPYHPQTLTLATELAAALCHHGDPRVARRLLEQVISYLGRESEIRLRALALLSEILAGQGEHASVLAIQRELFESRIEQLQAGQRDSVTARAPRRSSAGRGDI